MCATHAGYMEIVCIQGKQERGQQKRTSRLAPEEGEQACSAARSRREAAASAGCGRRQAVRRATRPSEAR